MTIEDYYTEFMGRNEPFRGSRKQVQISREELSEIIHKADRYDEMEPKYKNLKAKYDQISQELLDLKDDGRNLKDLQEELDKYYKSLLRVRADYDNYKKNAGRESRRQVNKFKETLLRKLIVHLDDLERATSTLKTLENGKSMVKGFEMIFNNFKTLLEAEGVKRMNAEGEQFDPYKHEVLVCMESKLPEHTILEVIENGYFFNNNVLRHAKVIISKQSNQKKERNEKYIEKEKETEIKKEQDEEKKYNDKKKIKRSEKKWEK